MGMKKVILLTVIPFILFIFMNRNTEPLERNIPNVQEMFADQEVTKTSVNAALYKIPDMEETVQLDRITDVEVKLNRDTDAFLDKTLHLYFEPENKNPEMILQTVTATTATAMQILFANDNVTRIIMWVKDGTMDSVEKEDLETLETLETRIKISMNEDTVRRGDWESLRQETIKDYHVLLEKADEVFIHPNIIEKDAERRTKNEE